MGWWRGPRKWATETIRPAPAQAFPKKTPQSPHPRRRTYRGANVLTLKKCASVGPYGIMRTAYRAYPRCGERGNPRLTLFARIRQGCIGDPSLRPVSPSARKSNAMAPKWHGGGTACPISGGKCGDCAVRNRSTCGVYVLSGDNPITRRSRSALRRDRRNFRPTKHVGGRLGSLWRNRPSLQSGTIR